MVAEKLKGNHPSFNELYIQPMVYCRKKGKQQLPTGAATTANDKETREENSEIDTSTMTFPADPTLLAYIAHVKQHIQPLPSIKDQVISLAM